MAKIRQSFTFGVLWHTSKVSCLCIWRVPTYSCWDEQKPLKASTISKCVTCTRKPMSLDEMDQDDHIMMIMYTIQHEYAPTAIALGTYPFYKVSSTHDQRGSLTQPQESIIQSARSPTHKHIQIYLHHVQCNHIEQESKADITYVPRVWPSKVQEI